MSKHVPQYGPDDVQVLDNVLRDTDVETSTRGAILKQAAFAAAVGAGVLSVGTSKAFAAHGTTNTVQDIGRVAATAEALAVTYLTAVINRLPKRGTFGGLPIAAVDQALRAANETEEEHYNFLHSPKGRGMGFQPVATRFWLPNDFFGPGLRNVPATIEAADSLFVNAYAVAIPIFARAGLYTEAMYAGQILGTEAQHLAFARLLQGKLPNNVAYMQAPLTTVEAHVDALVKTGVGFGQRGSKPGRFFTYRGTGDAATKISGRTP
ncbi:MAG TPA: hypothetical protein VNT23_09740 [Gaiellaceae bacterium]|nr:hypothetical protein [Gaiellaceae bacterium]